MCGALGCTREGGGCRSHGKGAVEGFLSSQTDVA